MMRGEGQETNKADENYDHDHFDLSYGYKFLDLRDG